MNNILIFLCFGIICGCSAKKETKPDTAPVEETSTTIGLTDAQINNAGIVMGKPQMRVMNSILRVNGLVDVPPQNMVTISFPSGGYLKSTHLLPGMLIRKGEVIAVMQDQSIIQVQEDYLLAQARYALLEKDFDRQRLLNASKASSDKVLEQTTSDFQSVKISLSAMKEKLLLIGINPERLTANSISSTVNIYTPINGFVAAVRVNIGKYVNPADVLFDLVNTSDLHLALTIFEKDVSLVHTGQLVRSYLTSDTATMYPATIMLVGKTLDSNRSILVHCHFTAAEPNLLPGMFMNAEIETKTTPVISVPEEAVIRSGDMDYVFIQRQPKVFELFPVSCGIAENGYVAISADKLDLLNQVIIIKNAYAALMKMKNTGDED